MSKQQYSVNQQPVGILLGWIKSKEIAIPEIQRPFVWKNTQVRDLIDSLFKGFPVGYIITWKNPDVKLKDGSLSAGKRILIDGQQRMTALTAAILGQRVLNKSYKDIRIKIAFNPLINKFEVSNPAIAKNSEWIDDISPIISGDQRISSAIRTYLSANEGANADLVEDRIEELKSIINKQIGIIELHPGLSIDEVTDIFIRINKEGVELGQADFVMSKIAANETYAGNKLRKLIDYFDHGMKKPGAIDRILKRDETFMQSGDAKRVTWINSRHNTIYNPDYKDIIRVSFTHKFNRGKLSDLVSLLSGRNFETREFEEIISEQSFTKLREGVHAFTNKTHFERFLMIIKSIGFIDSKLIGSKNVLNFAFTLYLKLRDQNESPSSIETYVKKWFVMSMLTRRYSGSAESMFDYDIKRIDESGVQDYLKEIEEAQLSDAFWEFEVVQSLKTSRVKNPAYSTFIASQCSNSTRGFLSKDITVRDMIEQHGDMHHIFPKNALTKLGYTRKDYNSVANYVYTQTEINIKIKDKPVERYMGEVVRQTEGGELVYGNIADPTDLEENLSENSIPLSFLQMSMEDYNSFLEERRVLIAEALKRYYWSL